MPERLTDSEVVTVRAMLRDYDRSRWLARLLWKISVFVGATIAGLAAFKEHIMSLLGLKGP